MPAVTVNGVTVAYSDTGAPKEKPTARTVVFGDGSTVSKWMFRAQVSALHARRPLTR